MHPGKLAIALACLAGSAHGIAGGPCERLFALRRSYDRNEVVYEFCFEGGAPARDRPVRVHWAMLETDGHLEELTALEERLAFGVVLRRGAGELAFALRAAPDRLLTLRGSGEEARAVMPIAGEPSALLDVYVDIDRPVLIPAVRYVELSGVSLATGALVSERVEP
jgi:hypothetical protein